MNTIGGMEKKQINWVKVIIAIAIVIILIGILIYFIFFRNISGNNSIISNLPLTGNQLFNDKTNSISLDIPRKYNLSEFDSNTNHVLELKSPSDLRVLVSYESAYIGEDDSKIINFISSDRDIYLKNYENTTNVSDIKQDIVKDKKIYFYTFDYTNSNKSYTLETIWITNDYGYYIIDINHLKVDDENNDTYKTIHSDVLNGFDFIKKDNNVTDSNSKSSEN